MDIVCSQVDQTYTISVKTVDSGYWFTTTGTNDKVQIKIHGTTHNSTWIKLDNDKNNFEEGDVDKFKITHLDLGKFAKLTQFKRIKVRSKICPYAKLEPTIGRVNMLKYGVEAILRDLNSTEHSLFINDIPKPRSQLQNKTCFIKTNQTRQPS